MSVCTVYPKERSLSAMIFSIDTVSSGKEGRELPSVFLVPFSAYSRNRFNPATPIALLQDIIRDVYMVLVMSVNPGFGGQKFIEHSVEKVKELRELIERTGSKALIEVDGGVNLETGARLIAAGADALVAGNAIFAAENPEGMIHAMKGL